MSTKSTRDQNSKKTSSTTIRVSEETKEKLENLDFVRKHTFDEIISELIGVYEKTKEVKNAE